MENPSQFNEDFRHGKIVLKQAQKKWCVKGSPAICHATCPKK